MKTITLQGKEASQWFNRGGFIHGTLIVNDRRIQFERRFDEPTVNIMLVDAYGCPYIEKINPHAFIDVGAKVEFSVLDEFDKSAFTQWKFTEERDLATRGGWTISDAGQIWFEDRLMYSVQPENISGAADSINGLMLWENLAKQAQAQAK
jgi:hypothetical protein